MTWVARWLGRIAAALVLVIAGYGTAGLIGGTIPVNAGWRPPATGVTIVIESNGVHTGFVMPKLAAGVDWRNLARARDLTGPRYARFDHVAIGWGEAGFYLETPHWRDVRPATVIAALAGSDRTLLHVEHVPLPRPAEDERYVTLRPEEYRRLAAFIRASLAAGGRHYPGYDASDVFYDGVGRYSAWRTCNEWAGAALRQAGVRVGAWTPFTQTVEGWF